MVLKGKAWKFGDSISTDLICPGRYFHLRSNLPELAKHVLEDADPQFASSMSKDDFVIAGNNFKVIETINHLVAEKQALGYKVGVITTIEDRNKYQCDNIVIIGSKTDDNEIAANLFKVLREMDHKNIEYIYCQAFYKEGIGAATMNRLLKAAGGRVIESN